MLTQFPNQSVTSFMDESLEPRGLASFQLNSDFIDQLLVFTKLYSFSRQVTRACMMSLAIKKTGAIEKMEIPNGCIKAVVLNL
jgi:hypothetical protein